MTRFVIVQSTVARPSESFGNREKELSHSTIIENSIRHNEYFHDLQLLYLPR